MMDRAALHARLDELLDAVERERGANSSEARAEAQGEVLTMHHALLEETGLRDLLQRRCVEEINGRSKGSTSEAADLSVDVNWYKGKRGTRALRMIAMRTVVDGGILPPPVAGLAAAGLYAASQGRNPPTGNEEGKHGGKLWEAEKITGVRSDSTPEMYLKIMMVQTLGYEAGFRGFPETRRLPSELLELGKLYWRHIAKRGEKGVPRHRSAETLRDWCTSTDSELRTYFEESYKEGLADRAAGKPKNKDRSLSSR
jgi:hypothetical protein